jgi:GT2 family glycosyltransferase
LSESESPKSVLYEIGSPGSRLTAPVNCRLFIIHSGGNLGFAGGCNVGAEYAAANGCDYIWLLNSDTVVHHSSLSELILNAASGPHGFTGSTLLYYRTPTVVQALGGADLNLPSCVIRHRGEGMSHVATGANTFGKSALTYIVGASMLVPVSLMDTIGIMQDDYFLYYEEIDWAFRSRGRYHQLYAPSSLIYHKAGASSKDKVSEFAKRLMFGNKLLFFARYIPYLNFRLRVEMVKELARDIVKGRWRVAKILTQTLLRSRTVSRRGILVLR